MREMNIVSGLVATDTRKNIKIRFNEYAIKKYGCNETTLNKFYNKYDKAVEFYQEKQRKRNNRFCYLLSFSNMVFLPSLGCLLLQTADPTAMATLSGISLGTMAISIVKLFTNSEEPYQLNRKNPYIEKGTIYYDMAKDYTEFKEQVLKKVR